MVICHDYSLILSVFPLNRIGQLTYQPTEWSVAKHERRSYATVNPL